MLPDSHVNYRCTFQIEPKEKNVDAWIGVIKLIRTWLKKKNDDDESFLKAWMFTGGEWKGQVVKNTWVRTDCSYLSHDSREYDSWALRYQHPDSDPKMPRLWTTDIGMERTDGGGINFSIIISHRIRQGYIGEELEEPSTGVPRVVRNIIRDGRWKILSGGRELSAEPISLSVGKGDEFKSHLLDHRRVLPIIYVSLDYENQKSLIDVKRLANSLEGASRIYIAETSEVDRELDWLLPKHLRCWNGMVRVYQPFVNPEQVSDGNRHRFFKGDQILERGSDEIESLLVRNLVRRAPILSTTRVSAIEDVKRMKLYKRIQLMKQSGELEDKVAEIELLIEENDRLEQVVKIEKEKADYYENHALDYEERVKELREELGKKSHEADVFKHRLEEQGLRPSDSALAETVYQISGLPTTIGDVLDLIGKLYPTRIAFTEQAYRSAKKCKYSDMNIVWNALWTMANTLHELYYEKEADTATIEQEYQSRTRYEVAMTEGGLTKNDNRLMRMRKDKYGDLEIDITPHIKHGKEPKQLRIYYAPVAQERKIVVGHFGHLETSGTRRMKK